ncbi:hypothetical protein TcYC6_0094440 [Trypanosoma cruzi]|uniref:Uncharacterized protein n=1 Tax=Trypanosoma cruzi (strain CL Brener) TaxID=353153 RepID=Q4DCZ4_TRYCC|nr:uncharacterized protein Tc00.1047053507357.20 [Trypanosoma cruzi]EAN90387.1 hypothetical protein Tc00.1047053507357.20 [Trypanosoma cruzi]KAF8294862.1 hypothetical protein TcYC6_0094550 [Trypanosoma cruzi]KAF8295212.1 hypothetical protein TcYC6_0094440 [Trypanosoma cruzi]|eukprot:XP_812238.1 hypothetical protein Tc00.1047053507357.20 [Trypanosoma cruzi strain CL Brener]
MSAWTPGMVFFLFYTDERLACGVHDFFFLLDFLPVQPLDGGKEVHVPDWDASLLQGFCNRGFFVSGLIAWDTAVRWGKYKVCRVNSLHQGEQHNPNLLSNAVTHGQWGNAECLNCRQGVRRYQDSCGRLGCFQTRRYETYNAIFNGGSLCPI